MVSIFGRYFSRIAILFAIFFSVSHFVYAQVVISEIMYDLKGSDEGREWVEIQNSGTESLDITGWSLNDGSNHKSFTFVSGSKTVLAQGFAVLTQKPESLLADWPQFQGNLFHGTFSLNNTSSTLILKNPKEESVDQVTYSSANGASGDGNSLQKFGALWKAAPATPGQANKEAIVLKKISPVSETSFTKVAGVGSSSPRYLHRNLAAVENSADSPFLKWVIGIVALTAFSIYGYFVFRKPKDEIKIIE